MQKKRQSQPEPAKVMRIRRNSDEVKTHRLLLPIREKIDKYFSGQTQPQSLKYYLLCHSQNNEGRTYTPQNHENRKFSDLFTTTAWKIKISNKCFSKLIQSDDEEIIKNKMAMLMFLADGNLPGPNYRDQWLRVRPLKCPTALNYNAFFTIKTFQNQNLFFNVGVQKLSVENLETKISQYHFQPYMNFLDILTDAKLSNEIRDLVHYHVSAINSDYSRGQDIMYQLNPVEIDSKDLLFIFNHGIGNSFIVTQTELASDNIIKYLPPKFKPEIISETNKTVEYDKELNQMVTSEEKVRMEYLRQKRAQEVVTKITLDNYIDFKKAQSLVNFLQTIPNFKLVLTEEEKGVIGQDGNVMVIGRSGTGKTTCAVLRLFAIEMLFKIRYNKDKKRYEGQGDGGSSLISGKDIEETLGLHSMFVTASPILTKEIKRYYTKMKEQVKNGLNRKKRKEEEKRREEQGEGEEPCVLEQKSGIENDAKGDNFEAEEFNYNDYEEIKKKANQFFPFHDLKQEDYPAFHTIEALVNMIDSVFERPFFAWGKKVKEEVETAWHKKQNKKRHIVDCKGLSSTPQNYPEYSSQDEPPRQLSTLPSCKRSKPKSRLSFEIDYPYFALCFWPQIKKKYYNHKNINSHILWTEIFSTIKGSATSHRCQNGYLTLKLYQQSCKNIFLELQQKKEIYSSFLQYEYWKDRIGAYDFMDVVNYLNIQVSKYGYNGPALHYLMIDQVQDLSHSVLYLLTRIVSNGTFYSGDTAQTIAKGVGFRFGDLKSLFDQKYFESQIQLKKPVVHQLTVNFRSHNNILQLANSIISLIQCLFPKTIDRLKKEKSDLPGPKPELYTNDNVNYMLSSLFGKKVTTIENLPPLEFGCQLVLLVRGEESKKNIPHFLKQALCLTIHEAKGLEFNDVILFNFFTDCCCEDKWEILKFIGFYDHEIGKDVYLAGMTKYSNEDGRKKDDLVLTQKIKVSPHITNKNINEYSQFCSDLKLLYTAVTRPKHNLMIYDEDEKNRVLIEKYWRQLGVVQTGGSTNYYQKCEKSTYATEGETNKKSQQQEARAKKAALEQWNNQGRTMFNRKLYDQAVFCFSKSGNKKLQTLASAYNDATRATNLITQVEAQNKNILDGYYQDLPSSDLHKLKQDLREKQQISYQKFQAAGKLFSDIQEFEKSAQCYFSAKLYEQAHEIFLRLGKLKQAAECLERLKWFQEAAQLYFEIKEYRKQIQCLNELPDREEEILGLIDRYADFFDRKERAELMLVYASVQLEKLVDNLEGYNAMSGGIHYTITKNIVDIVFIVDEGIKTKVSREEKEVMIKQQCFHLGQQLRNLMFRVLEKYHKMRLCMYLANKWELPREFERYFASFLLASSHTAKENMKIQDTFLTSLSYLKRKKETEESQSQYFQKNRKRIRPKFLPIDFDDSVKKYQKLGIYFSVSMMLLGFSKDISFFFNVKQRLPVFENYFNDREYRDAFFRYYWKMSEGEFEGVYFLQRDEITNKTEEYTVVMFQRYLWKMVKKYDFIKSVHNKRSALLNPCHTDDEGEGEGIGEEMLPKYFMFNRSFWGYVRLVDQNKGGNQEELGRHNEQFQDLLYATRVFIKQIDSLFNKTITEYSVYQIYDMVTFALLLLHSKLLRSLQSSLTIPELTLLYSKLTLLLNFLHNPTPVDPKSKTILQAIYSLFHIRTRNPRSETMTCFGDYFVYVHRNSSISLDIVEAKRVREVEGSCVQWKERAFFAEQSGNVILAPYGVVARAVRNRLWDVLFFEYLDYAVLTRLGVGAGVGVEGEREGGRREKEWIVAAYYLYVASRLERKYEKRELERLREVYKGRSATGGLEEKIEKYYGIATNTKNSNQKYKPTQLANELLSLLSNNIFHQHPDLPPQLTNFLHHLFKYNPRKTEDHTKLLFITNTEIPIPGLQCVKQKIGLQFALNMKQSNDIVGYGEILLNSWGWLVEGDRRYYVWDCILAVIVGMKGMEGRLFEMGLPRFLVRYLEGRERLVGAGELQGEGEGEEEGGRYSKEDREKIRRSGKHLFGVLYVVGEKKDEKRMLGLLEQLIKLVNPKNNQQEEAKNQILQFFNSNFSQDQTLLSRLFCPQSTLNPYPNPKTFKNKVIFFPLCPLTQKQAQFRDQYKQASIEKFYQIRLQNRTIQYYEEEEEEEEEGFQEEGEQEEEGKYESDSSSDGNEIVEETVYEYGEQDFEDEQEGGGGEEQYSGSSDSSSRDNEYDTNYDDYNDPIYSKNHEDEDEDRYDHETSFTSLYSSSLRPDNSYLFQDISYLQHYLQHQLPPPQLPPSSTKKLFKNQLENLENNWISLVYCMRYPNTKFEEVMKLSNELSSYLVSYYMQSNVKKHEIFNFIVEGLVEVYEIRKRVVEYYEGGWRGAEMVGKCEMMIGRLRKVVGGIEGWKERLLAGEAGGKETKEGKREKKPINKKKLKKQRRMIEKGRFVKK